MIRAHGPSAILDSSSPLWDNLLRLAALGLALLCLAATTLHACGPDFPNTLLDGGDAALFSAPVTDFERELERLKLAPTRFAAVIGTNSYEQETLNAEIADLGAALKKAKVSPEESEHILNAHRTNREKLRKYQTNLASWYARSLTGADGNEPTRRGSLPAFPIFEEVPGLPGEFADYFAGAAASHNPAASNSVREAWERLLARPAAERKYKSTWAAFMLGKTWEHADDDKAVEYFQMTRDLAKQRCADSIGLASAAIGLEARVELRRKHFDRAMKLYLEQYATGDGSAVVSLRWTAQQALAEGGEELTALAGTANTRSVVTAYLISGEHQRDYAWSDSPTTNSTAAWLKAVETADVKDVESAERLGLAAYQAGEFQIAQRWVNRARSTPAAQWIQAKLWLRSGKVQAAATMLANIASLLPVVTDSELTNSAEFADSLHMGVRPYYSDFRSARTQVLGELGVLRLSRRDFTQALDALLRAGFWMDAAYVAERVLTTDELKDYVDRFWPLSEDEPQPDREGARSDTSTSPALLRENIRYLLARRLTREDRNDQAPEYYPTAWRPKYREFVTALQTGWNETLPPNERAHWLFDAAVVARTNGMELLGTEVEPDWQIHGGSYDWGVTWRDRATNGTGARINLASAEEINRASEHHADPEQRFHYRYQAAFLGWEAAKLLPNNSDDAARVLCTSGSWLKDRDPETADIFYKALVRRCRKTELGEEADRRRWFPPLDESGNIIRQEEPQADPEPASPPEPLETNETEMIELVN